MHWWIANKWVCQGREQCVLCIWSNRRVLWPMVCIRRSLRMSDSGKSDNKLKCRHHKCMDKTLHGKLLRVLSDSNNLYDSDVCSPIYGFDLACHLDFKIIHNSKIAHLIFPHDISLIVKWLSGWQCKIWRPMDDLHFAITRGKLVLDCPWLHIDFTPAPASQQLFQWTWITKVSKRLDKLMQMVILSIFTVAHYNYICLTHTHAHNLLGVKGLKVLDKTLSRHNYMNISKLYQNILILLCFGTFC